MSTKGKKPAGGSTYVYTARGDEALGVDDLGASKRRTKGDAPASAKDTEPAGTPPPISEELDALPARQPASELPVPSAPPPRGAADEGPAAEEEPRASAPKATVAGTPRAKGLPPPDARLATVEKLLARGAWSEVAAAIGEPGPDTPPLLRLLWAVARKEATSAGAKQVSPDGAAIEATAQLLGLDKSSTIALVLAKRLLRRRTWVETPAPRPWVSVTLLILGLALGASIGWMIVRVAM